MRIVDRRACQMLVVLKLANQCLQLAGGAVLEHLFRGPLLALGQYHRLALHLGSHGMHLRGGLIQREEHGNHGHAAKQGQHQPPV